MKELISIQSELIVPKTHWNDHGKYMYRNNDEILEAAKPLCKTYNCLLTLTDEIIMLGDRYYVKSTAKIKNSAGEIEEATAAAREPLTNNAKMDASQITGTASSYAQKRALGGLFCLDDNKDADANNKAGVDPDEPKVTVDQLKEFDDFYDMSETKVKSWIDKYKKDDMLRSDAEGMLIKLRANK